MLLLLVGLMNGIIFPSSYSQDNLVRKTESLVAHEWGTFTSLQGSDGEVQAGMHHEEEALPSFVHGRDPLNESKTIPSCINPKCLEEPLHKTLAVTQKMETPVIYLYSPTDQKVNISIDFPRGIISQYYPMPSSFLPEIGDIRFLGGSNVQFQVEVTQASLKLPTVPEGNVYAPAREVASHLIKSGAENEKFIFYRGLGDFATSFKAKSSDGNLTIENQGDADYPAVFLVYSDTQGGTIKNLGKIEGNGRTLINQSELKSFQNTLLPMDQYLEKSVQLLTHELTQTGLYPDESLAMANTWKSSYFKTPGLRVLYVLSRKETDQILPFKMEPSPTSLVRTMVGRVEIFLDREEQNLLNQIAKDGQKFKLESLGRLAEPKLRRLQQLTSDRMIQKSLEKLLIQLKL